MSFSEGNVVTAGAQVQGGEPGPAEHCIDAINEWKGVSILVSDSIDGTIVYTEPQISILLGDQGHIRCPWTGGGFYHTVSQHLIDIDHQWLLYVYEVVGVVVVG